MKHWYSEEHGVWMCEPDCVDEWLFDIWAIGVDYDGCQTSEELKKLIDELVTMIEMARGCLWENKLFGAYGEPKIWRVPSKEEWMAQYGTPKQIAGYKRRCRTNDP